MTARMKLLITSIAAFAAFALEAAQVTTLEARRVASAWAQTGTVMGRVYSSTDVDCTAYPVANAGGNSFYAVKMGDGSTIITSSDDEFEPIIAFSSNSNLNLSAGSPLRVLLERDIRFRAKLRELTQQATPVAVTTAASATGAKAGAAATTQSSPAKRKWRALLGSAKPSLYNLVAGSAANFTSGAAGIQPPVNSIDDVCVAPLLKTKWSQQTDKAGNYLYNYHTPNHYPCGCTATANGQIMNYFQFPTNSMPQATYPCVVDGVARDLTTIAGVYDWALMAGDGRDVNFYNTEEQRAEIGKLLYDLGVVLKSDYSEGGTGALMIAPAKAYRSASFGYKSAFLFARDPDGPGEGTGGLHNHAVRAKCIYANLDDKRPVEFGILDGNWGSGHAVVGDGYGFKTIEGDSVCYVHVNLGWAGQDDAWYNLPEIDAKTTGSRVGEWGIKFEILEACAFNISPDNTGDILSGRVTDDDGQPLAGVTVKAYSGSTLKGATASDERGIYAFTLPGGNNYKIVFETPGMADHELSSVHLPKTTVSSGYYADYYLIENPANVGNSWGNDMEIADPCVRNLSLSVTYPNLNKALDAAEDGDVLEVFAPARLKRDYVLTKEVEIHSTSFDGARVTRVGEASITVANGGKLTLRDVGLVSESVNPMIIGEAGAKIDLAGQLKLGTVKVADDRTLKVVAPLTVALGDLVVNLPSSREAGMRFGSSALDFETTTNSVANIANYWDDELGGFAMEGDGMALVWKDVPVDPSIAIAKATGWYLGEENVTMYYKSYTKLFRAFTNGADIVVLRNVDPTLDGFDVTKFAPDVKIKIAKDTTIQGTSKSFVLRPGAGCCFEVETNATLTITKLTIDGEAVDQVVEGVTNKVGYSVTGSDQIFRVNGGTLNLGTDLTIQTFTTGSLHKNIKDANSYGPIYLKSGELNLSGNATIKGCHATGNGTLLSYGGGIAATGGRLNISGNVAITDCSASKQGAGVYLWCNAGGVQLTLDGRPTIDGLYMAGKSVLPKVKGTYDGRSSAQVKFEFPLSTGTGTVGGGPGCTFAIDDGGVDAETIAAGLVNANDSSLTAVTDGSRIFWQKAPTSIPGKQEALTTSTQCIVHSADGSEDTYWTTIPYALQALEGDASIEVVKFTGTKNISAGIDINYNVELYSTNSTRVKFNRTQDVSINVLAGASLSLSNIAFTSKVLMSGDQAVSYTKPYFNVNGGALALDDCEIDGFQCTTRAAGGVKVWNGGQFHMKGGTVIQSIRNVYVDPLKRWESGSGAGVLVEGKGSFANLESGGITGCQGTCGGGLFVGNEASAAFGAGFHLYDNLDYQLAADEIQNNAARQHRSVIELRGVPSSSKIGLCIGPIMLLDEPTYECDTNMVARIVGDDSYWTPENLKLAAGNVRRDPDGCVAKVVTNENARLLVWRSAVGGDDYYTAANGEKFALVGFGEPKPQETAIPKAQRNLEYNGNDQFGLVDDGYMDIRWAGDTESELEAADAGTHYATVQLIDPAFVWEDGSSDPKTILWRIAKKGLRVVVEDGVPDWNLAEHTPDEAPGQEPYEDYFNDYIHVEGVCCPPDETNDVILIEKGYYTPGGLLMTNMNYKVGVSYTLLNDNYMIIEQVMGQMRVVSNVVETVDEETILKMISNPKLVLGVTSGKPVGTSSGVGTGSEGDGTPPPLADGVVLEIENAPAGTYKLNGSDTLTGSFATEATQTLTRPGKLRLQAPPTEAAQHFWRIEYVKP